MTDNNDDNNHPKNTKAAFKDAMVKELTATAKAAEEASSNLPPVSVEVHGKNGQVFGTVENTFTPEVEPSVFPGQRRASNDEVSYATQMRMEKADEEGRYFKRGEIALKDYHLSIEKISSAAKKEFALEFHEFLSLARRVDTLDDLRQEKLRKDRGEVHADPNLAAPPANEMPSAEEICKLVDERLGNKLKDAVKANAESNKYERELQSRDREIERLQKRLDEKSPEQKIFERMSHRKSKKLHGSNHIKQLFKFPLTQSLVEKLYEVDQAVSEFLLDLGKAEWVITKENVISTAARRLMKVRGIDEPVMVDTEFGKKSRWADILDRIENPKKYNSNG